MKAFIYFTLCSLVATSLNAKELQTIQGEVQGDLNKLRIIGIEVVGSDEYKKLVEDEYEKELNTGYIPDNALISAIHYADVTILKSGNSPNLKVSADRIYEEYKPSGSKEDYEIIGTYFDALNPEFDASSYRRLAGVLAGGLTADQVAKLADNLTKLGEPGKLHYNHIYRALQDSLK
jgi:hypothetical protein